MARCPRSRRECTCALERTERRLPVAQQRLSRLGRFGHKCERAELEAEVERQTAALRLGERQLAPRPVHPERTPAPDALAKPLPPAPHAHSTATQAPGSSYGCAGAVLPARARRRAGNS